MVRYGEKSSKYSQLRNPSIFLQCLLDKGYIGKTPHSDIEAQYGVLRDNGLGRIEEIAYKRYRFYLADAQYAKNVIKMAKQLIETGQVQDEQIERGIIEEAWNEREKLSGYEFSEYIPSLRNAKVINDFNKKKEIQKVSEITNGGIQIGADWFLRLREKPPKQLLGTGLEALLYYFSFREIFPAMCPISLVGARIFM